MAELFPFGPSSEVPSGYYLANNLNTDNAQVALAAPMGIKLSAIAHRGTIFVAASNAPAQQQLAADYLCTGTNDELVIQQAVNEIYENGGGTLMLSRGTFHIDSFPNIDSADPDGGYSAIYLPSNGTTGYEIKIIGDHFAYGSNSGSGTRIEVSDNCYESLNSSTVYKVFHSTYSEHLANAAKISLVMMNISIGLPWNQKKILCIDLRSVNRVYMQFIKCAGYRSGYNGYVPATTNPPAVAAQGCIGIRMTSGSNYGVCCDYKNISCSGFYEGFQVGGEHVIGINLSGIFNVYSYTFGNYSWKDVFLHPITLINCCDERSVNMPLFAYCGTNKNNAHGGQQISLIDFNMERTPEHTPGGVLGELATELVPGTFHGEISYTIQANVGSGGNRVDQKFWKDGHGQRFISRNSTHKLACGTTERNGYAPTYLQRIWDTDLGKEVICTNTATKEWRDTAGNIV